MLNMALLLRVVNEGEHMVVNQVVEEVDPSVEVGVDIGGTTLDPDFSATKASPGCIQPYLVFLHIDFAFASIYCIK